MAQVHLTLEDEILKDLMLGNRENGVAKLLEKVFDAVLRGQASEQLNAEPYERSDGRVSYRNGYRERTLTTRVGTLILHVPKFRDGTFSTDLFRSYQRSEKALLLSLMEMVVQGVSTRKVEKVFSKFGLKNISASEVSRIAKKLDKLVKDFLNRPIEGSIPYIFVDASYFKVRTDGRYVNKALLVVVAIHDDGYREILSATVDDSEDESCWENCFESLKARGLKGVKLVISDAHKGIQAAVQKSFLGASWRISLTEVSESFDEVETCVMFTLCVLCSRTYLRKRKRRSPTC